MRNVFFAVCMVSILTTTATAQTLRSDRIFPEQSARYVQLRSALGAQQMDLKSVDLNSPEVKARLAPLQGLVAATIADQGTDKGVFILLPTVPVTFNSLEKDSTGEWRMGAAMTAGVGATFVLGKATYEGATTSIHPWIIGGAAINTGLKEKANRQVTEALNVSAFFGFGNAAVNFSRDILHGTTAIGLSLKLDVLTNMAPDAFLCLFGCHHE